MLQAEESSRTGGRGRRPGRAQGEAPSPSPEALDRCLEKALAELRAYRAGTLEAQVTVTSSPFGELLLGGSLERTDRCVVTLVRAGDRAVAPVVVRKTAEAILLFDEFSADGTLAEIATVPPRVHADGSTRYFRATYGHYLVGIIELSAQRAVLLVALEEQFAILYVDPIRQVLLHAGVALALREIDLASHLRLDGATRRRRPPHSPAPRPRRVPITVRRQHARLAYGHQLADDVPPLDKLLERCADYLSSRVKLQRDWARRVLRVIFRLRRRGAYNLEGRVSELTTRLNAADPSLGIRPRQLSVVLRELERIGTILVYRPTPKTWVIRVEGLEDPSSPHHRALMSEIPGAFHSYEPSLLGEEPEAPAHAEETSGAGDPPRAREPAARAEASPEPEDDSSTTTQPSASPHAWPAPLTPPDRASVPDDDPLVRLRELERLHREAVAARRVIRTRHAAAAQALAVQPARERLPRVHPGHPSVPPGAPLGGAHLDVRSASTPALALEVVALAEESSSLTQTFDLTVGDPRPGRLVAGVFRSAIRLSLIVGIGSIGAGGDGVSEAVAAMIHPTRTAPRSPRVPPIGECIDIEVEGEPVDEA